jgi:excisionase family DNA binding protein
MKQALRLAKVAQDLGVHPTTFRRWCETGHGPRHLRTPGGTYLFRQEDIEKWLKSLESFAEQDSTGGEAKK